MDDIPLFGRHTPKRKIKQFKNIMVIEPPKYSTIKILLCAHPGQHIYQGDHTTKRKENYKH